MAKSITLDNVEVAQIVLMRDKGTGKVLVRAAYHVKAGNDIVKTVPDRILTFLPGPGQSQPVSDLMSAQEQAYGAAAWDSVVAALQRLEL